MEWTNELTLKLIDSYRECKPLWQRSDSTNYRNANVRAHKWEEIANEFGCSVEEIRKKLASLLASFRRERLKESKAKDSWKSKWFAFKPMSFLLLNKPIKCDDDPISEIGNNSSTDDDDSEWNRSETVPIEEVQLDDKPSLSIALIKKRQIKSPLPIKSTPSINQSHASSSSSKIRKLNNGTKMETEESTSIPKSNQISNDSSIIFGNYVATKLSGYTQRVQNVIQHKINNILFDADMGNFDET